MLRRRLSVPQHSLLVSTWPANFILTHHLRAILRLPGELRPRALQSFCSLAYHRQIHQLGDNSPTRDSTIFSFSPSQQFSYGGLLGVSTSTGNRELGRPGTAVQDTSKTSDHAKKSGYSTTVPDEHSAPRTSNYELNSEANHNSENNHHAPVSQTESRLITPQVKHFNSIPRRLSPGRLKALRKQLAQAEVDSSSHSERVKTFSTELESEELSAKERRILEIKRARRIRRLETSLQFQEILRENIRRTLEGISAPLRYHGVVESGGGSGDASALKGKSSTDSPTDSTSLPIIQKVSINSEKRSQEHRLPASPEQGVHIQNGSGTSVGDITSRATGPTLIKSKEQGPDPGLVKFQLGGAGVQFQTLRDALAFRVLEEDFQEAKAKQQNDRMKELQKQMQALKNGDTRREREQHLVTEGLSSRAKSGGPFLLSLKDEEAHSSTEHCKDTSIAALRQRLTLLQQGLLSGQQHNANLSDIEQLKQVEQALLKSLTGAKLDSISQPPRKKGKGGLAKRRRESSSGDAFGMISPMDLATTQEMATDPYAQTVAEHRPESDMASHGGKATEFSAISELKLEIAELKNMVKGLLSQQALQSPAMSKSSDDESDRLASTATPTNARGSESDEFVQGSINRDGLVEKQEQKPPSFFRRVYEDPYSLRSSDSADAHPSGILQPVDITSRQPKAIKPPLSLLEELFPEEAKRRDLERVAITERDIVETSPQSLLEELFPEEAAKRLIASEHSLEKTVPRLPLPGTQDNALALPSNKTRARELKAASLAQQRDDLIRSMKNNEMTVLSLKCASPSLTEEDFRALIPRGKHIQEWVVRGEYSKVFPKRDPWTLERDGGYYIVFPNASSALAYRDHVRHVHGLAKQHTPTNMRSPIPPPPGYLLDGEDVHDLVRRFALVAPSQKLDLNIDKGPWTRFTENLLRRGGYAQIIGEGRENVPQVMIEMVDGPQPSWYDIKDALFAEGKRRGLEWGVLGGAQGIRKVAMERHNKNGGRQQGDEDEDGDADEERDEEAKERREEVRDRLKRPSYGQRWILAFETKDEAGRFARTWHKRPFPWAGAKRKSENESRREERFGEAVTVVNAEVLW